MASSTSLIGFLTNQALLAEKAAATHTTRNDVLGAGSKRLRYRFLNRYFETGIFDIVL